ncbi:hypothetical protein [Comamonas odontotermitis]|uniref:hypothetical protein n=1 Tax=Comamonas odontotermitis TaxID=379895 RepID=UPI001CC5CC4F|nr:hypothetical protein [Comamonas odontotermitis]UBB18328.1 hypothetical protein LAD35_06735 [Comamonas odontotermitis]
MNGFSDAHYSRLASAHKAGVDRQDARAAWLEKQRSSNSIFDQRFNSVHQEAFKNFDPDTLGAIFCLLKASKPLEAGEMLRDYLREVMQDECDDILEAEAEEAGRDW